MIQPYRRYRSEQIALPQTEIPRSTHRRETHVVVILDSDQLWPTSTTRRRADRRFFFFFFVAVAIFVYENTWSQGQIHAHSPTCVFPCFTRLSWPMTVSVQFGSVPTLPARRNPEPQFLLAYRRAKAKCSWRVARRLLLSSIGVISDCAKESEKKDAAERSYDGTCLPADFADGGCSDREDSQAGRTG